MISKKGLPSFKKVRSVSRRDEACSFFEGSPTVVFTIKLISSVPISFRRTVSILILKNSAKWYSALVTI